MEKANCGLRFKTRYAITVLDKETNKPVGETTHVENIVLNVGYTALSSEIAYTTLGVGSSNTPASVTDVGLLMQIGSVPLADGAFTQTIAGQKNAEGVDTVTSTIRRDLIVKEFTFAENSKTLDINEIGLVGVTRAVLPQTITITKSNWLKVTVWVEYTYGEQTGYLMISKAGGVAENYPSPYQVGSFVSYTAKPIVFNPNPANNTGRGWGIAGSVLGYVWDGSDSTVSNRTYGDSIGVVVTPKLNHVTNAWDFEIHATQETQGYKLIPGFVLRDTVNGAAYKIAFQYPIIISEDDTMKMTVSFQWGS